MLKNVSSFPITVGCFCKFKSVGLLSVFGCCSKHPKGNHKYIITICMILEGFTILDNLNTFLLSI